MTDDASLITSAVATAFGATDEIAPAHAEVIEIVARLRSAREPRITANAMIVIGAEALRRECGPEAARAALRAEIKRLRED